MVSFRFLKLFLIGILFSSVGCHIALADLVNAPARQSLVRIQPYHHERDCHELYHLFNANRDNLGQWAYDDSFPAGKQIKVAHLDDQLAGFVIYNKSDTGGFIDYLAVDKQIRNKGLGKLLLNYAVFDLQLQGANSVALKVYDHNTRAQSLYERLGFYLESAAFGLKKYVLNIA